jgi:hypothetical protein
MTWLIAGLAVSPLALLFVVRAVLQQVGREISDALFEH